MTTGEGGIVTTNNKNLSIKMKSIREFGKEKKGIYTNYHTSMGYNWRMPEVSALMGISQLKSVKKFISKRKEIAEIYRSYLKNIKDIRIIEPSSKSNFNYFKFTIILENQNRTKVHNLLAKKGINLSGYVYELPLHKQPVFNKFKSISLPETEFLCAQHICLPIYPNLSLSDAKYIVKNLINILEN